MTTRLFPMSAAFSAAGRAGASPDVEAVREWARACLLRPPAATSRPSRPCGRAIALSEAVPFSFVYGGRRSAKLLPGWKRTVTKPSARGGKRRQDVVFTDPQTHLKVTCELTLFDGFPAVEWLLRFTHTGRADSPILSDILPLDLAARAARSARAVFHHGKGSTMGAVDEYLPLEARLGDGRGVILPPPKMRSQAFLPYFHLELPGGGIVGAIGWTGQWSLAARRKGEQVRVTAGQQLTRLSLHPGESIRTPRILLVFSTGGDRMRGHNLLRRILLAHYVPRAGGRVITPPIAVHSGVLNEFTESMELDCIRGSAGLGVEAYWRDAGWFEGLWPHGAGNWRPRKDVLPDGFDKIARAARKAGMKFLLWFEPERVVAGSRVAKAHPEWVLTRLEPGSREPGGAPGACQDWLFNLADPKARAWMTDLLSECIRTWGVDIYRHDRNTQPVWYWRAKDRPDRRGITEIRYVEGLYAMWDELRRRHPHLVIDNANWRCTGPDLEAMSRSSGSFTRSETADCGGNAVANQVNTAGLSLYLPLHGNGLHALTPYMLRSVCTTNAMHAWHLCRSPEQKRAARKAVAEVRLLRTLCLGDYYPLTPIDADESHWCAWQFHRPDRGEGVAVFFRRPKCRKTTLVARLCALDASARYRVDFRRTFDVESERTMTGEQLARLSVKLTGRPASLLVHYKPAKSPRRAKD